MYSKPINYSNNNFDTSNQFWSKTKNILDLNSKPHYVEISDDCYMKPQTPTVNFIEHYRNIYASPENFIKRQVNYEKMKVFDEKLRKESERLKTFNKCFPNSLKHLIRKMTKSGFYYIGNEKEPDKVKCIFCQGVLFKWQKNDVPERDHKKAYPTCPLLLNLNVGNVPMEENGLKPLTRDPDLNCTTILYNVISKSDDISLSMAKHLTFDIESREKTFKNFEHLKRFVFDGLFIIDKESINYIKCIHCDHEIEILKNIEKLSPDFFHKQWCSFLKLKESFISNENILIDKSTENTIKKNYCQVEYSITDDEIEARMDSRTANIIEELFPKNRETIKKIITNKLKRTGKDYESKFDIIHDLKNYKEMNIIVEDNNFEFAFQDYSCVVCLDNIISTIFLPCGHFKTCRRCSKSLSSCPVCRKLIEKRVTGVQLNNINNI